MRTTNTGKFFLEKAQNILNEYQTTLQELKGFSDRPTIKLGTLRTIRISSLARLIHDFQTQGLKTLRFYAKLYLVNIT
jgi:DNA-binding transcriptional LysR family regulator